MATKRTDGDRKPTLTEQVRRAQLIDVTRELIAARGYHGVSLAGIAETAGVTKAAVLYYFPSKNAVLEAAYLDVLTALTDDIARAVEEAEPADGPAAYIRSMVGHLREYPSHVRIIVEAMQSGAAEHDREERWRPLAEVIDRAGPHGPGGTDSRAIAVIIGGGIDAIVAEHLNDPDFDSVRAAESLVRMVDGVIARLRDRVSACEGESACPPKERGRRRFFATWSKANRAAAGLHSTAYSASNA